MIFNNDGYQRIQGETRRYVKTYQFTKNKFVTTTLQIIQNITARISTHKKPDNYQLPGFVIKPIKALIY
ncbi:hypothetical protein D3C84_1166480 [compost metagenome]